jgi:hypothetical protein
MKNKFTNRAVGKAGTVQRTEYVLQSMFEGDNDWNGRWINQCTGENIDDVILKYRKACKSGDEMSYILDFGPGPKHFRILKREIVSEVVEYFDSGDRRTDHRKPYKLTQIPNPK